jgi:hypothetical protein
MMETHKEKPARPPECGPESVQGAEQQGGPNTHSLADSKKNVSSNVRIDGFENTDANL